MDFNFISHLKTCSDFIVYSSPISLILYTHIPSAILALLIGFTVLIKNRTLIGRVLFGITVSFFLWVIVDLILWLSTNSLIIMLAWSLSWIIGGLISVLSFLLFYYFLFKDDLSITKKILFFSLLLPLIILNPTNLLIDHFDLVNCVAVDNIMADNYYYFLGLAGIMGILILFLYKWRTIEKSFRKQALLMFVGLEIFLCSFFSLGAISSYTGNYYIEFYGLFGMVIFMAFLSFLIVRFKAFDIKLVGAQALVWALVIMIGAEFLFVTNLTSQILVGVTLMISAILGLLLVRSVKKEVALREELEIANNNQQSLIHFITHQVKGFFTKSKMIFAGILEGDFGEASAGVKGVIREGLNSDNNAVMMVQNILSASNLKSGTVAYTMTETDFMELVREIAKDFEEVVKNKNLAYSVNIPAEKIMVMADKTQISQAVKNLIDNSVKYTPAGKINVSLKKVKTGDKNQALFEVNDTGVGLSDDDKQKLFTEGGKGGEATKTNIDSTGFGLYIIKKIVENHNGKVWAESTGRGRGSQFYISLPIR